MIKNILFLIVVWFSFTGITQASPLRLEYDVNDIGGGLFEYDFSLILDNNDNSWASGQGWSWFVFGDAELSASPLTDFHGDASDLPVGPWTGWTNSGGGHNGPTFNSTSAFWVPAAVGAELNWSGTSTADLVQGELLYSTLGTDNGAVQATFAVANRIPIPAAVWLFGSALAGLGWIRRKRTA